MNIRHFLITFWRNISESYWFLPSIMGIVAAVLALVVVRLDSVLTVQVVPQLVPLFSDDAATLETLASVIASSSIAVLGTVFSMLMVVLTLASQQYGPLVLDTLMRDRFTQVTIGVFSSTFVYCLLVLATINPGEDPFVPRLAGLVANLLAVLAVAVLVLYIHHVAVSITAARIISRITHSLLGSIDDQFPDPLAESEPEPPVALPATLPENARPIYANGSGYMQLIANESLVALLKEHDALFKLNHRPGAHIIEGERLGWLYPAERYSADLATAINEGFLLGDKRTHEEDIEFIIYQLTEIGVRALSPGVNDPYTAIICLNKVSDAVRKIGQRRLPPTAHYDEAGNVRLIGNPVTFEDVLKAAYDQIAHYGAGDHRVMRTLFDNLETIGDILADPDRIRTVRAFTDALRRRCEPDAV